MTDLDRMNKITRRSVPHDSFGWPGNDRHREFKKIYIENLQLDPANKLQDDLPYIQAIHKIPISSYLPNFRYSGDPGNEKYSDIRKKF
jgi:hypothetical protein